MIRNLLKKYKWCTSKPKKQVAVVIPIYKKELNRYEVVSLDRCFRVLSQHQIVIIKPPRLDVSFLKNDGYEFHVVEFPQEYFESVNSYSRLLLSSFFYERFLEYKYILIYQMDSFVFQDDLLKWCRMDYDYIGAPWLGQTWPMMPTTRVEKVLYKTRFMRHLIKPRMVGNGGFSLRKIKSFMLALMLLRRDANKFQLNEDMFWSLNVPKRLPFFKIPPVKLALGFSIELEPKLAFELRDHQLPFGCHAWEKFDINFWRLIFREYGYHI